MRVSLVPTFVIALVAGFLACGAAFAQEASTPLQRIVVIAREARLPFGVVLGTDKSLCQKDSWSPADRSNDPLDQISTIGRHYGYSLDRTSPPVLRNLVTTSEHLQEGLGYRYSSFPALHGTMPFLSATLTGWMQSEYGHARGWGMSIVSAPGAEEFQLPASLNASTEEIAGKIVSLGGKGVWIASDLGGSAAEGLRVRAEFYLDDLQYIQFLKCD